MSTVGIPDRSKRKSVPRDLECQDHSVEDSKWQGFSTRKREGPSTSTLSQPEI